MPDRSLVFIHGFGSAVRVWTKLIRLIRDDPDLGGVQIFPFPYRSRVMPLLPLSPTRTPDYDDIAQLLETQLAVKAPGNVAIVTHSQGGLILQRFLAWMLNEERGRELARIRLIVMLACPNEGSGYLGPVRVAAGFRHHPQGRDLGPLSADVIATRRKVLSGIDKVEGVGPRHCHIPIYAYAGSEDNVVTRASAQDGFTNIRVLPGDHSSILVPDSPDNITFPELKRLLLMYLMAPAETENVPAGQSGETFADPTRARPALEMGSPLIEETLSLTLTSEGIQVVRVTEGRPDDRTLLAVPSARVMEEYHRALREARRSPSCRTARQPSGSASSCSRCSRPSCPPYRIPSVSAWPRALARPEGWLPSSSG
jgi:pimeloyl-ACP methyl ester carboxylesterase